MVVRQEDRREVGEPFGRQPAVLAGVEEQGVIAAGVVDEEQGVAGRPVDELDLGRGPTGGGEGHGNRSVRINE